MSDVTQLLSAIDRGDRHPAGNLSGVIPRRLFSLATACALWFITHAAVAEYRFDVWTTDSGLPQNSISKILQSRDGYLWLEHAGWTGAVRRCALHRFRQGQFSGPAQQPRHGAVRRPRRRPVDRHGGWRPGPLPPRPLHHGRRAARPARETDPEHRWGCLFSRGKLTTLTLSNGLPSLRVNQVDEDQHGTWWVATS
jgi:hypothetical protein